VVKSEWQWQEVVAVSSVDGFSAVDVSKIFFHVVAFFDDFGGFVKFNLLISWC
jgi:hypothetical protein